MPLFRRALEALVNGLLVALLAPPLAGLIYVVTSVVGGALSREPVADTNLSSLSLLLLGATSGAYLVGAAPSFVAGLTMPALRAAFSPLAAALVAGAVGSVAYLLSFGAHVMDGPDMGASLRVYVLPAFCGVAAAALLGQFMLKPRREAS